MASKTAPILGVHVQPHPVAIGTAAAPAKPLPAIVDITKMPGSAYVKVEPHREPHDSDEVSVYSTAAGSCVKIDVEQVKGYKKNKIPQKCQEVWKEVKDFLKKKDEKASNIVIDAHPNPNAPKDDLVLISYRDGDGNAREIQHYDIPDEILQKLYTIRRLLRPDRSPTIPTGLQLSAAGEILPKACREFFENHLETLQSSLEGDAKKKAGNIILATEAAIQGTILHLSGIIDHKEKELEKIPLLPHEPHKKAEDELNELKKLLQELQSIDRYAVFSAIAHWSNLNTGPLDETTTLALRQKADQVTIAVKKEIQERETKRQKDHWIKNSWLGKKFSSFECMEEGEMHKYALDAGNLLLPKQTDIIKRQNESETGITKPGVEQLIVQMMMNLRNPNTHIDPKTNPLLSSLKPENQQILLDLIGRTERGTDQYFPKAYARDVYEELEKTSSLTLNPSRIKNLSNRKDPRLRFDKLLSGA